MPGQLHKFIVVWICTGLGSVTTRGDPEVITGDNEPNDTITSATPTGLIDLGTAIVSNGQIGNGPLAGADRDLFSFELTTEADLPRLLTVGMNSDALDGYVKVFDASGVEIAHHDDADYPDPNPILQTYLLQAGVYYVGVSDALNPAYDPTDETSGRESATGGYELAVTLSAIAKPDGSLEPNDAKPTPIDSLPFSVTNRFIGNGPNLRVDVDRYALEIEGPSILHVTVRPAFLGALDPLLSVEVDFAILTVLLPNRPDLREQRIEAAVFEAQTAEIIIRGTNTAPEIPEGPFGSVGFYDLDIDLTPVSADPGPFEPNDSLLEATLTGLDGPGSADFAATIGDGVFGELRGDMDCYEFSLGLDERVDIDIAPTVKGTGLLPVAHLYDFLGEHVLAWPADESGAIQASFQRRCFDALNPPAEEPEVYVLAIIGQRDRLNLDPLISNPETYPNPDPVPAHSPDTLNLALHSIDGGPGSTGDYNLTLTIVADALPHCGDEPDDTILDAGDSVLVDEGHYLCGSGAIGDGSCPESGDDVDFFRVETTAAPVTIDIRLTSTSCLSTEGKTLRLFDASGTELAVSDLIPGSGLPSPTVDSMIRLSLIEAGEYYVGVSDRENDTYDPLVACSGSGSVDTFSDSLIYELEIRLIQPPPDDPTDSIADVGLASDPGRLFATRLDFFADTIVELDPLTGDVIASLPAPEAPIGGSDGLAFDGTDLFALGRSGRHPFLYRLDPDTGEILDRALMWFGSGMFGDVVALGDKLYLNDLREDAIYVFPTSLDDSFSRLDMGLMNGISLFGPLAATVRPHRLVAPDAADPSVLHEIDPAGGGLRSSIALQTPCGCNADFDGDGDVDGDDQGFFDGCDAISGVAFGCQTADLNCDGDIDAADATILDCQHGGAGNPPSSDCCPEALPQVSQRATSLAGTGPNTLVAGDWTAPILTRFHRGGVMPETVSTETPVGALAGKPFAPLGDWEGDGDIDLLDWQHLQACFTGTGITPFEPGCEVFDFDADEDVDLFDFAGFQELVTGVAP